MELYVLLVFGVISSAALPLGIVWLVQRGKLERALLQVQVASAPDAARLDRIESRLATLEAIVTDTPGQLARDIAAL
ncbi:hypothetical protein [Sandaracinobacteroides saxicola]|uniref:Uncharacterized protein n=1 Tax=Sandaracinobacteroides saxicola TaxID=2759707 RepID=A0A7G5IIL7_9SPHN|nr:hypothetical protein [Sandaracinobacteroides saxicola]QMW23209.1 hypothetical protein H3309_01485 [Sandaracinobacteroides saxicola]